VVPVTAGPGDQGAAEAAARGHLRASHADREQVIETLKAAFVQGRLAKDELDLRVGQTLASRTYADLGALTADLPAGLARARAPETARQTANKKAVAALGGATLAIAGIMAAPTPSIPDGPVAVLIICVFWLLCTAVLTGWVWLLHDWVDKRASRKPARGLPPGAGGETSQRRAPAGPGGQLLPGDDGRWHTAEAAPIVRPRRLLPT
jgi:DUF1707 SHOCT-like domain